MHYIIVTITYLGSDDNSDGREIEMRAFFTDCNFFLNVYVLYVVSNTLQLSVFVIFLTVRRKVVMST